MFYPALLICLFSTTFGTVPEYGFVPPDVFLTDLTPFVNAFLMLVQTSQDLQNILSSAVEESKNYDALYNTMLPAAIKYQEIDLHVAKSFIDVVFSVVDKLTPFNLARIFSTALEEVLKDHQLITITNASELATLLANSILNKKRFMVLSPYPAPNIDALSDGILVVIHILNIESPKTARDFSRALIKRFNELKNSL